jgi:hypothetical protein
MRLRNLRGSLTRKKFFMTIFEFIGQFYLERDVFKLQEAFSKLEIRERAWKFPDIS